MPRITVNAGPNPPKGVCEHGTPTHDAQGHRTPCSPCEDGEQITIKVQDTPSGRLLARSLQIMRERLCTLGEAMDEARAEGPSGSAGRSEGRGRPMKVRIEITVAVDPVEWQETYGLADASEAGVRDDVKRWAANAITHHPDGLIELVGLGR